MSASICRVCLYSDLKMHSIESMGLQEIYEKIASTKLNSEDGRRPVTICYICCARLQNCHRFSEMTRRAEVMFAGLLNNGMEISQKAINRLNLQMVQDLSATALPNLSINDNPSNPSTPLAVKEEFNSDEESSSSEIEAIEIDENMISQEAVDTLNLKIIQDLSANALPLISLDDDDSNNSNTPVAVKEEFNEGEKSSPLEIEAKDDIEITENKISLFNGSSPVPVTEEFNEDMKRSLNTDYWLVTESAVENETENTGSCSCCEECSKVVQTNQNMVSRIQIHTEEKPFTCDFCHKECSVHVFYDNSNLRIHVPNIDKATPAVTQSPANSALSSPKAARVNRKTTIKDTSKIRKCITKYPCLWDPSDPHFRTVRYKYNCRLALLEELNKILPNPLTLKLLKTLIKSYRRRMLRHLQKATPLAISHSPTNSVSRPQASPIDRTTITSSTTTTTIARSTFEEYIIKYPSLCDPSDPLYKSVGYNYNCRLALLEELNKILPIPLTHELLKNLIKSYRSRLLRRCERATPLVLSHSPTKSVSRSQASPVNRTTSRRRITERSRFIFQECIIKYPSLWDPSDPHYRTVGYKYNCRLAFLEELNKILPTPLTHEHLKTLIKSYGRRLQRHRQKAT